MRTKSGHGLALAIVLGAALSVSAKTSHPEMNRLHDAKLLYRAIVLADTKMAETPAAEHPWDWTSAVFMMGLGDLHALDGSARYHDYYRAWIDHHLAQGFTLSRSDQIGPGRVCLRLYRETQEPRYLEAAERIGRYLLHEAVRTREGGLIHFGPVGGSQMWIDSLFMYGPFLVELSQVTGDPAYAEEALRQCLLMFRHLQDRRGLCRHRWSEAAGETNPAHWLRGNGWAFAATALVLAELPEEIAPAEREQLLRRYQQQAQALVRDQAENGLWHTVIDRPGTYQESSGSALVLFGICRGLQAGLLGDSFRPPLQRGLFALLDKVKVHPNGFATMTDISLGTRPGDAPYYNDVELSENVTFGVGAFLMAAVAWLELEKTSPPPRFYEEEVAWDHLRWGRVEQALAGFNRIAAEQPDQLSARAGAGLTEMILLIQELEEGISDLSVQDRGMTPSGLQKLLTEKSLPALERTTAHFQAVEADPDFGVVIEQMVFAGTSAVGYMEWDRAEVFALDGAAHLLGALAHLATAYNLEGPPLLLARREFGPIVRDPDWPGFLTLTAAAPRHLPLARQDLITALEKFRAVYEQTFQQPNSDFGKLITPELLRLQGKFHLPGNIPPTPVKKIISGNPLVRAILAWLGPRLPERVPRYLEKGIQSLRGETIPLTESVGLNLGAFFDHPADLRWLFPEHLADGSRHFADPTLNGILPGMTNSRWKKILKWI